MGPTALPKPTIWAAPSYRYSAKIVGSFEIYKNFLEQEKITQILSAAGREIETLPKKLICLQQEKKAPMQQLLTSKLSVTVDKS